MRRLLIAVLWVAPGLAMAQVEELENPGTVAAVQERLYRMSHELAGGPCLLPLDAFYKGLCGQIGYTYHFTDWFAWQVGRGGASYSLSTGLRDQLERDFGVLPTAFDEVQWFVGSDVMFSPLYGKTAVLNKHVLHFETYVIGGGSVLKFSNSPIPRPALNVGVGGRLFHNRWISYRLELTNNIVIAPARAQAISHVMFVNLFAALNFGATE